MKGGGAPWDLKANKGKNSPVPYSSKKTAEKKKVPGAKRSSKEGGEAKGRVSV